MTAPPLLPAAVLLLAASGCQGAQVQAELLIGQASLAPGATVTAGIRLAIEPGWHVYWRNPGDSGTPVRVAWRLPPGVTAGPLRWPTPRRFDSAGVAGFGYEREVVLLADLALPDPLPADELHRLAADVRWLACAETCVPGSAAVAVERVAGDGASGPDAAALASASAGLPAVPEPARLRVGAAAIDPAGALVLTFAGDLAPAVADVIPDAIPGAVVDYAGMLVADGAARLPLAAPVPRALPAFEVIVLTGRGAVAHGWTLTIPAITR